MSDTRRHACPVCGSHRLRPLRAYARAYLVRCSDCGLTFSDRFPTDAELEEHYDDYGHAWIDSPITRRRYRELLALLAPHRRLGRLLDIGCGAGFFLEEARAQGWEAHGNEYSRHAIEVARAKGLEVVHGPITETTYPPASFDVITAFEVFEHVRDPAEESALIARLLRPGGVLYCTTPNFNSLSRRLLRARWNVIEYPEHLVYYTPATLTRWLAGAGLQPVSVTSSGISLARMRDAISAPRQELAPHVADDEGLRATIEGSRALQLAKAAANDALGALGAGDTLKARFELRQAPTPAP
jgi:2-polyprenyl-3-methyl-5-hydroxy-6-metoxy-1,4-benzoquinol methylase